MKLLIFFDLPTITEKARKQYTIFHKQLIKSGFIMIQYSVYVKHFNHQIDVAQEVAKIHHAVPNSGHIRALAITQYQWEKMQIIQGEKTIEEYINNNEKYIKI